MGCRPINCEPLIDGQLKTNLEVKTMNTDVLKGKWKQVSGDVKKSFGKLTDDDLMQVEGNQEKIIGKLQERYGYSREQAEREWKTFTSQHRDYFD
jgi:uncharacterized protein YjbJ (UPF0337 family)